MLNLLVHEISKQEAEALIGGAFSDESFGFCTDGIDLEYHDGFGTIWQVEINATWDYTYDEFIRHERHTGEDPASCWTEWEAAAF